MLSMFARYQVHMSYARSAQDVVKLIHQPSDSRECVGFHTVLFIFVA